MVKKFISLLAVAAAIGVTTLFGQEPGAAKTGEARGRRQLHTLTFSGCPRTSLRSPRPQTHL